MSSLKWLCYYKRSHAFLCEFMATYEQSHSRGSHMAPTLTPPVDRILPIPHTRCPAGHLTHQFLACDMFAACWLKDSVPRSETITDLSGIPSRVSCPVPLTSLPPLFNCRNEHANIAYSLVCDGREDCPEGDDEQFCQFPPCSGDTPLPCGNTGKVSLVLLQSETIAAIFQVFLFFFFSPKT